jgi:hypothetical protein
MSTEDRFDLKVTISFTVPRRLKFPYVVLDEIRRDLLKNRNIESLEVHSEEA